MGTSTLSWKVATPLVSNKLTLSADLEKLNNPSKIIGERQKFAFTLQQHQHFLYFYYKSSDL